MRRGRPLIDPQTQALFEVGFIQPIDIVLALLVFSVTAVTSAWCGFGHASLIHPLIGLLVILSLIGLWTLILIYRCLYFVIKTMAEIKMIPASAAQLALKFGSGANAKGEAVE